MIEYSLFNTYVWVNLIYEIDSNRTNNH